MAKRDRERRQRRYTNAKEVAEKQQQGFELTTLRIPKGCYLFSFKEEKTYKLVILPYRVGKGNPNAGEGFDHWERTYYVHPKVGAENKKYACPMKCAGKKCFIHDHANELQNRGEDFELVSGLRKLSKRQVIAVFDLNNKEKGIGIYEGPYSNGFGEKIDDKLLGKDDDSPFRKFYFEESFMKLEVRVKKTAFKSEGTGQSGTFMKPVDLEMEPLREGIITDEILDSVPCLDDLIYFEPYDKLKSIFLSGEEEETDPDDEDDDSDDDDDEEEVSQKKPRGKSVKDDDEDEGDDSDDEDDNDEEDEETDDDDSDEDEEDEEEQKKPVRKGTAVTASIRGIEVGTVVMHEDHGECTVVHISKDGTSLRLEDSDGEIHSAISPDDVEVKKAGKAAKPSKNGHAKKGKADDDWEDEESEGSEDDGEDEETPDEDEDEEEDDPVVKKRGRPAKKK